MDQEEKESLENKSTEADQEQPVAEPTSETKPASLPSATTMFVQAWKTLWQQKKIVLAIYLVPLITSIGYLFFFYFTMSHLEDPATPYYIMPPEFWVSIAVYAINLLILSLALTSHIYVLKENRTDIGVLGAYRGGLSRFRSYLWAYILFTIIVSIGFALFIIPAFIFLAWFILAMYIAVAEKVGGAEAIVRSYHYVDGHTGATLWRTLFFFGAITLITLLLALLMYFSAEATFVFLPVLLILFLLGFLFVPLAPIYFYSLYARLRDIKGEFTTNLASRNRVLLFNTIAVFYIVGMSTFYFMMFYLTPTMMTTAEPYGATNQETQETGIDPIEDMNLDMENIRIIYQALRQYQKTNGSFPMSLNDLVPDFLDTIPLDLTTGAVYTYEQTENGNDFSLCYTMQPSPIFGASEPFCYNAEGMSFIVGP